MIPTDLTIAEAQQQMAAGTLSSEALVQACLARMHAATDLNIMITVDDEGALAAARAVDTARAAGQPLGPLAGIPLVIKDNIHAKGLPSTAGTPALKDFVPTEDAPVVQALRDAGAIVLGKTNMHELAFGATGYNAAFHVDGVVGVRNPYDPERIAGGSSSGSAAALGARMSLTALGTDTGVPGLGTLLDSRVAPVQDQNVHGVSPDIRRCRGRIHRRRREGGLPVRVWRDASPHQPDCCPPCLLS